MTTLPALQIPPALSTDWLSTVPMAATGQPLSSDSLSSAQANGKLYSPLGIYLSLSWLLFVISLSVGHCSSD